MSSARKAPRSALLQESSQLFHPRSPIPGSLSEDELSVESSSASGKKLPPETERALLCYLVSPDRHGKFASFCNQDPTLFGNRGTELRRRVQRRRDYLLRYQYTFKALCQEFGVNPSLSLESAEDQKSPSFNRRFIFKDKDFYHPPEATQQTEMSRFGESSIIVGGRLIFVYVCLLRCITIYLI